MTYSDHMPPVGGAKSSYLPLEDECAAGDGVPYPEHDFPPTGEGNECWRCGAEAEDGDTGITFAWCFSHGRLHCFTGDPWCTANWVTLPGVTEDQAMEAKRERYGDAQFLHHLPDDQQIAIIKAG